MSRPKTTSVQAFAKDTSSMFPANIGAIGGLVFPVVLLIVAMLPIERANAVATTDCGGFYTPSGGIAASGVFDGTTCTYDLAYGPLMTPEKPVDLQFPNPFPGTTYVFDTFFEGFPGSIHNFTNFAWGDYHFELGTGGTGTANVFTPFTYAVGTDPMFLSAVSTDIFGSPTTMTAHSVGFSGAVVPNSGGTVNFQLSVGTSAAAPGSFTLRQYFTVPEPATVLLMGLGLAGLGFARRRRLSA